MIVFFVDAVFGRFLEREFKGSFWGRCDVDEGMRIASCHGWTQAPWPELVFTFDKNLDLGLQQTVSAGIPNLL